MMKIIDISLPLSPSLPVWPGSLGIQLNWSQRMESGDECNNSVLNCDTHVGTHMDAPFHFLEDGETVDRLSLDILIGPAFVAYLPGAKKITPDELSGLSLPAGTERLLIRTRNSELWVSRITEFRKDFVALTTEGAQWLVDRGIRLVGVDYLSVGSYNKNGAITHRNLLEAGVVILEGLNLYGIDPKIYELICLPLKIVGAEGAPARAVLIKRD
ncbi:MAG: cyclase family protein [Deltaproteobacteria bacterium]|nr:cyclase family protein [Deltaproteobacteria bacterium]